MRCDLTSLLEELQASSEFVECNVRGEDGAPVAHTTHFRPTPELPNELQSDSTADVQVCLGMDKGGRGTATAKLVLTTLNQKRPMSRGNSVMLSAMPCAGDSNEELHAMLEPWMSDVPELLDNGIVIDATLRAMRLLFTGDLAFLYSFFGASRPHRPDAVCLVLGRLPCECCQRGPSGRPRPPTGGSGTTSATANQRASPKDD